MYFYKNKEKALSKKRSSQKQQIIYISKNAKLRNILKMAIVIKMENMELKTTNKKQNGYASDAQKAARPFAGR